MHTDIELALKPNYMLESAVFLYICMFLNHSKKFKPH